MVSIGTRQRDVTASSAALSAYWWRHQAELLRGSDELETVAALRRREETRARCVVCFSGTFSVLPAHLSCGCQLKRRRRGG